MSSNSGEKLRVHMDEIMPLIREKISKGMIIKNIPFSGVSMLPLLREGLDSVDIGPLPEHLKKYDLPIYRNKRKQYVMHRIVSVYENYYICRGDNTFHDEIVYPDQMIALVCLIRRGKKSISVKNTGYRIYCTLWYGIYPVRKLLVLVKRKLFWKVKNIKL